MLDSFVTLAEDKIHNQTTSFMSDDILDCLSLSLLYVKLIIYLLI